MFDSKLAQERVFIIGDGSLCDESVTRLLTCEADLLVSHATYSDDPAFLNVIRWDRPDVILVNESGSLDMARILDLVSSDPTVMGLPIVVVRPNNNVIDVFARPIFVSGKVCSKPQRIIVKSGNDLFNAVRRKHNEQ